jgi:L-fuconolactonase
VRTIDSHQHFWRYSSAAHPWIGESMGALRRDFLPSDLRPLLDRYGIDGCVAVQAQQSVDETEWLLELAESSPWILGVVGWVEMGTERVYDRLERFRNRSKLCGIRHVVQDEPDDRYLLRREFMDGVAALGYFGLTYDLLVYPRQLPAAIELVARFPTQRFVLDHGGKPEIRGRRLEPWKSHLRELAKNRNVYCKVSGLVTEADWKAWTPQELTPYLDAIFEAFGVERLMWGSDWPVCTLAADYGTASKLLDPILTMLPQKSRDAILGGNALRFYSIP